jgi:Adenylate cyclase, class 2 (thermophilic)
MGMETEAKLRVASFAPIRSALLAIGAGKVGRVLERNWILDTVDDGLLSDGVLLRLRNTGGARGVVAVKGKTRKNTRFKSREEVETTTDDYEKTLRQFALLGYTVVWIYEKIRESWLTDACRIELDHCPEIGDFIEVEGSGAAIGALLSRLGLDPAMHISDGYLGLWRKHLKALGQSKRDMIFSEQDRRSLDMTEDHHDTD